jgi:ribonuclease Z
MIEVHFLGVGAALPALGQTNCSYLVRAGDVRLLVDCGPAVLQQLAAFGQMPGDVTHLFISHRHGDHALGYPMFVLWWGLIGRHTERVLPTVLASTTTWASLGVLWDHSYGDLPRADLPRVELPPDKPSAHALAGGITLRTWPVLHSHFAPVLALRLEYQGRAVAFTADTGQTPALLELARGADLLVHDARYSSTVDPQYPEGIYGHCTASAAGTNARQAGARRLALVHVGAEYVEPIDRRAGLVAEASAEFGGEVLAPNAGDRITIE